MRRARLANVHLGIEGVREYWAVQRAVDELGADRVIFGSDFPLGHPRMYLGLVDALRLSARAAGAGARRQHAEAPRRGGR